MHLHQHIKTQSGSGLLQVLQILIREDRCNQQHGISTGRAGLEQLIRAEDEFLAQQRQIHRLPHLHQHVEAALKKGLVGEHRQAACTAGGVGLGNGDRIEILPDHPLAGACLLHFRDHGRLHRGLAQGSEEVPCRRQILDLPFEGLQRHPLAGGIHFTVFGPDDLFKDVLGFLLVVGNGVLQMRDAHLRIGGTTTDLHGNQKKGRTQAVSWEAACL